ncbi:MAG: hypothetical protein EOS40_14515 [Mesorhizobium sp.]|nr:MAG: hypothetical protein EOQ40_09685 [Mesorhizobium sp.]RWE00740.1 MAG: hypothetical protein EOS40_14515 [Mesorhizobium sp.]TIS51981.1 MAG: hypothetical protein E5W96_01445 [Mesorhizobium sp.]TIT87564.1 MAG: hypothetical protein E5W55_28355 [Mesorhizobium sp.]
MSPGSVQRFWDNDMHQNKDLKARRLNPFQRDALYGASEFNSLLRLHASREVVLGQAHLGDEIGRVDQ